MIAKYHNLQRYATVFRSLTGLRVGEFDRLVNDMMLLYAEVERARHTLTREGHTRQRAVGGGPRFSLSMRDQLLLAVIWLRQYPTNEVLGFLFGVSDSTVSRIVSRVVPILAKEGKAGMRMPDPGRKHRRTLDDLLREIPELGVVIDTFEQPVQRPKSQDEADKWYSGKKKRHTIKSQVGVDRNSGEIVDVGESVRVGDNSFELSDIRSVSYDFMSLAGILPRLRSHVAILGYLLLFTTSFLRLPEWMEAFKLVALVLLIGPSIVSNLIASSEQPSHVYVLNLRAGSGTVAAYASLNWDYVQHIVSQIKKAKAAQGTPSTQRLNP